MKRSNSFVFGFALLLGVAVPPIVGCAGSDSSGGDGTAAGNNALSGNGAASAKPPATAKPPASAAPTAAATATTSTQTLNQVVTAWAGHSAFDKLIGGAGFWDQPAIQTAMSNAMGPTFYPRRLEVINGPQEPLAADPDDPTLYAIHACKQAACNEVALFMLIDLSKNVVKVLWDETGLMIEAHGDQGQITWLDKGQEVGRQEGCRDSLNGEDPATVKDLFECLVFQDKTSGIQ
jgi:hypothetical protein